MCSHLVPRLFTRHQLAGYLRNGKKIRDPMRQLQSCLFGSEPAGAANLNGKNDVFLDHYVLTVPHRFSPNGSGPRGGRGTSTR